jgi:hypothetical protein
MTLLGLDWNATRVRAVTGPAGDYALPVPLEPPEVELAAAISLEHATPEVGAAGLRRCRSAGHQVCQGFLPFLTDRKGQGPHWQSGRHSLDCRAACELVWTKLNRLAATSQAIVLTTPGYLQAAQAALLCRLAGRLPVVGSVTTILTAALAGHVEQFWQRSALVIDVDEHALTLGWVKAIGDKAHVIDCRSFTHLGLRFWKERLLNVLAELCVRQHRRDPRDVPQAEQSLYDQLDSLADAALKHQAIQLGVQGSQWFKHLLVHPEETVHFCQALALQAALEAEQLLGCWPASELPRSILLTHAAGRLPGLVEALRSIAPPSASAETRLPGGETSYHDDDFGEELMFPDGERGCELMVLSPEAPARAAHSLADLFRQRVLPPGHLETIAPLIATPAAEVGPPRLHFMGRDYLLRDAAFTVGSQFGCQLHFDRSEHPDVSPRHCEITFDHRDFTLHNRCREGTLVNDHPVSGAIVLRPGDRIRLGPRGPLVRFLGKLAPRAKSVYV